MVDQTVIEPDDDDDDDDNLEDGDEPEEVETDEGVDVPTSVIPEDAF